MLMNMMVPMIITSKVAILDAYKLLIETNDRRKRGKKQWYMVFYSILF